MQSYFYRNVIYLLYFINWKYKHTMKDRTVMNTNTLAIVCMLTSGTNSFQQWYRRYYMLKRENKITVNDLDWL